MRYIISGRNIAVNDSLRAELEKKFSKMDKYFNEETEAKITLSTIKDAYTIEVTIPTKFGFIRGEATAADKYAAMDEVEEIIVKQIRRYKKKIIDRTQSAAAFSEAFLQDAEDDDYDEDEIRIAKVKRFAVKPMDPEEACLQMEMLHHDFFVFLNSETNQVNVVYKRKGSSYGLIEPEM